MKGHLIRYQIHHSKAIPTYIFIFGELNYMNAIV